MSGSPNSCLIKIGKRKLRSLFDSGAEVSLMHKPVCQSLKEAPRLINKKAYLQSVNGDSLSVDGCVEIDFTLGGTKLKHVFYSI